MESKKVIAQKQPWMGLPKEEIFDLRSAADLADFEKVISPMINEMEFTINELPNDQEKIISLRAMLISFYAKRFNKRLVVGIFEQREQRKYKHIMEFAAGLNIVFGVETIYCVRDISILQNIR